MNSNDLNSHTMAEAFQASTQDADTWEPLDPADADPMGGIKNT
jgi:hypothetical protein